MAEVASVPGDELADEYAMGWEAAERRERQRIAGKLHAILITNIIWPQATADAMYGLLRELDDGG